MGKTARLRAGVAVMDITPPVGYRLFGHAARKLPSDGVHDPLRLKVLTLFDGRTRLAIVTSDLIDFSAASVATVRRLARERLGLSADHLLLTSSHTHTGPCMSLASVFMPPEHILPDYISVVEKKIVGGIREAMNDEAPVSVHLGEAGVNAGAISRRLWTGKELLFRPNPAGPVDDRLSVLRLDGANGSPRAILFRYSCHPTVLSAELHRISADYPGAAQAWVERAYPGTAALFLQGCCGDVRPAIVRKGEFAGGTFAQMERMGQRLGEAVVRACECAHPIRGVPLRGRAGVIRLPMARSLQPTDLSRLKELAAAYARDNREFAEKGYVQQWAAFWRRELRAGRPRTRHVPMAAHVLRLGEVTVAALAAEVMAEYGTWLRQALGPKTIVVGYADGDMGYLPTREALAQGGYEAVFHLFENYSAPFDPRLDKKVIESMRALAAQCV
jgi:hypothetical protein